MKVVATVEVLLSLIMHHYKSVMRQVSQNIKDLGRFLQRSETTRFCSTLADTLTGKKSLFVWFEANSLRCTKTGRRTTGFTLYDSILDPGFYLFYFF